jgi:DNA-binding transcriptional LysR family regulator
MAEIASFVALVENDGFTTAARAMNLSQAAFSARIHRLERALGVTLVDRSVKRLTLTREGRAFQPLANSLLVMLSAVVDSVDAHRAGA